jgi:hypothetical protein
MPRQGITAYPELSVATMCEPWQAPKTVKERNTNLIVALPQSMMAGKTKEYCGKEVIATFEGKTIGGLVAWDGCMACNDNVSTNMHPHFQLDRLTDYTITAGRIGLLCYRLWSNRRRG